MAWHVNLASLFSFTALLLQPGEVLGASCQNQLVHLSNSRVLLKYFEAFSPLSGHFGLESEG